MSHSASSEPPPLSTREGQLKSAFCLILEQLCSGEVGSVAAALVDSDGETVDHAIAAANLWTEAGRVRFGAFDLRLTAAHWQLVVRDSAAACKTHGALRELRIVTDAYGYLVQPLPEGYVLLVVAEPKRFQRLTSRSVRRCVVDLCREAGWPVPRPSEPVWERVAVRFDAKGYPEAIYWENGWRAVQATPTQRNASGLERAFDLVVEPASTMHLVCEPSGACYCETEPDLST